MTFSTLKGFGNHLSFVVSSSEKTLVGLSQLISMTLKMVLWSSETLSFKIFLNKNS